MGKEMVGKALLKAIVKMSGAEDDTKLPWQPPVCSFILHQPKRPQKLK